MTDGCGSWPGRAGIVCGLGLWAVSVPVLALLMQANEAATQPGRLRGFGADGRSIAHLESIAVLSGLGFIALQIAAVLTLTFALRAAYRLRTAVCFTIGAGMPLLLDACGLFGLLLWLRLSLGAR